MLFLKRYLITYISKQTHAYFKDILSVCTSLPALPALSDPEPSCLPSRPCRRQPGSLWRSPSPWARRAAWEHTLHVYEWKCEETKQQHFHSLKQKKHHGKYWDKNESPLAAIHFLDVACFFCQAKGHITGGLAVRYVLWVRQQLHD